MSYQFENREPAEKASTCYNEKYGPRDVFHAAMHDVVRGKWGVVRYRQYEDRLELGWINRGFVWVHDRRSTDLS